MGFVDTFEHSLGKREIEIVYMKQISVWLNELCQRKTDVDLLTPDGLVQRG